ncbi:MAG: NAD-dependent epimerase/dehydratase family protein [Actinobacteria bacterium]|nr:NAD-dependent epimerase/dehydratase family protein [Actinomycetota bacterium]
MRALVTGGAGFIGSNLVDALIARGDQVAVLDDLSSGKESNLDAALAAGAELHRLDVRDAGGVDGLFAAFKPQLVFHLAAQMDVRRSLEEPGLDASVNVVGTVNVLDAAAGNDVERLVNTSTGGVIYGDAEQIPTPEHSPALPLSAYGQSKQCAELYCGWAGRLHGLETVTLRCGNVYGPRQDPSGDAGVVAIFAGCLLSGERPTIFGDGSATRDYTFVDDIVAANLLAADAAGGNGPFNIGTGVESSVLDLVAALDAAAAPGEGPLDPQFAPARAGEVERSALAVNLAAAELGFRAQTALDDGVARTLSALRG